jgi:hypothetical protein
MTYLIKFSAQDGIPCLLCNFQGLHFRLNIEGDADVARNFFIFLQTWVEVTRSISIPEKGDMTKLDCLTAIFLQKKRYEQAMHKSCNIQSFRSKTSHKTKRNNLPASVGANAITG